VAAAALGSSLAIAFLQWQPAWLVWLGSISYSLYLSHEVIGPRIIVLSLRRVHSRGGLLLVELCAVFVSLLFAYWMSQYVEAPAMRLASRIRLTAATRGRAETAEAL
jgi:peptidoglycan/LPS O-acetylase OafA/YrhL